MSTQDILIVPVVDQDVISQSADTHLTEEAETMATENGKTAYKADTTAPTDDNIAPAVDSAAVSNDSSHAGISAPEDAVLEVVQYSETEGDDSIKGPAQTAPDSVQTAPDPALNVPDKDAENTDSKPGFILSQWIKNSGNG